MKEAEEVEKKKRDKKRNRAQSTNFNNNLLSDEFTPIGSSDGGSVWYFYNTSANSRGRAEFTRVWGNRSLEDNWRRSSKTVQVADASGENNTQEEAQNEEENEEEAESKLDKNVLIATIPYAEDKQNKLLSEIEEASYNLGKIYHFDLDEDSNSASTFETTLGRFPETDYRPEIMYLLFLIYKKLGNLSRSDYFRNILLDELPESIYAKIIVNPNYRAESQAASEKLKKLYAQAYDAYKQGKFKRALSIINDGLRNYPENDFVDNMELLKILVIGKSESIYKYQFELNNFVKTYSESELKPYADSLILASETFQINLINSTRAQFKNKLTGNHFFVYVYETDPELSETLPGIFDQKIIDNSITGLKVGNLILDDKHSMILISEFTDKESALSFNQIIEDQNPADNLTKTTKFYNFVITKENFNIFYETKELSLIHI